MKKTIALLLICSTLFQSCITMTCNCSGNDKTVTPAKKTGTKSSHFGKKATPKKHTQSRAAIYDTVGICRTPRQKDAMFLMGRDTATIPIYIYPHSGVSNIPTVSINNNYAY